MIPFLDPLFWVLVGLVLVVGVLGYFFEWFWKVFPFAEKHPLAIWALVMLFFLGLAFVV